MLNVSHPGRVFDGTVCFVVAISALVTSAAYFSGPAAAHQSHDFSIVDFVEELRPSVVKISVTRSTSEKEEVPGIFDLDLELGIIEFDDDLIEHDGMTYFYDCIGKKSCMMPVFDQISARYSTKIGTGFIVHSEGFVVSSLELVENSESVQVELFDGRKLDARTVGSDARTGIALLKVEADGLTAVRFGDSEAVRAGERVLMFGHSPDLGTLSVFEGVLAFGGRSIDGTWFILRSLTRMPKVNLALNLPGVKSCDQIGFCSADADAAVSMNFPSAATPSWSEFGYDCISLKEQMPYLICSNLDNNEYLFGDESPRYEQNCWNWTTALICENDPSNYADSIAPVFDRDGNLVSVHTQHLSPRSRDDGFSGLGFSISSNDVSNIVNQLIEHGKTKQGWLGVRLQDVTTEISDALNLTQSAGALITDVLEGPGREAGLRSGDVIVRFQREHVKDSRSFIRMVADAGSGTETEINVLRGTEELVIKVILSGGEEAKGLDTQSAAQRDTESDEQNILGLQFSSDRKIANQGENGIGLLVLAVQPDSAAEIKGIRSGDVITAINLTPLKSVDVLRDSIEDARDSGHKTVVLRVNIGGRTRYLVLPIERSRPRSVTA